MDGHAHSPVVARSAEADALPPLTSAPAPSRNPPPRTFTAQAVHCVRTSQQMNLSLSQMADQKASILMGATFVVFTIAVGQAKSGNVPVSLSVLALFAFLSALCAVFAVLPSIKAPPKQAPTGGNLLFFGTFTQMDEQAWADLVMDEMRCDETMFRMMLHDVYQNGQVLQRKKFRYLGHAYRIFIVGLTLTLVTFIFEHMGTFG